jgi:hypothetical protein
MEPIRVTDLRAKDKVIVVLKEISFADTVVSVNLNHPGSRQIRLKTMGVYIDFTTIKFYIDTPASRAKFFLMKKKIKDISV